MNTISFSYNWNNKLDCKSFTTLRLSNKHKIGDTIIINLKNKKLFNAKIIDKNELYLENINEFIAHIDTGYSRSECQNLIKKMYKNKNINWETQIIYLYLIERVK